MIYIGETLNYSILYEIMNAPWHMAVALKGQRGSYYLHYFGGFSSYNSILKSIRIL